MVTLIVQLKNIMVSDSDKRRIIDDIRLQASDGGGVVVLDKANFELLGVIGSDGTFVPYTQNDAQHHRYRDGINGT